MQPYFSRVVQKVTDETGRELNSSEIFGLFNKTYLSKFEPYKLNPKYEVSTEEKEDQTLTVLKTTYLKNNEIVDLVSTGNGSVDAFVKGFRKNEKLEFKLDKYFEHAISFGSDSKAAAYVKLDLPNGKSYCGVGIDSNISVATNKAIISAVNLFA
jgi:2-isopropylmalate synthase